MYKYEEMVLWKNTQITVTNKTLEKINCHYDVSLYNHNYILYEGADTYLVNSLKSLNKETNANLISYNTTNYDFKYPCYLSYVNLSYPIGVGDSKNYHLANQIVNMSYIYLANMTSKFNYVWSVDFLNLFPDTQTTNNGFYNPYYILENSFFIGYYPIDVCGLIFFILIITLLFIIHVSNYIKTYIKYDIEKPTNNDSYREI